MKNADRRLTDLADLFRAEIEERLTAVRLEIESVFTTALNQAMAAAFKNVFNTAGGDGAPPSGAADNGMTGNDAV